MLDDVGDGKIVGEEKIFEAGDGENDEPQTAIPALRTLLISSAIARADCENAAHYRVRRADECEKEGE